ncbi:hypothetical protein A6R68_08632 [Neotoma lepida]|uniref:Uncharacterized protein n=1 Tax=Neotoma lepida TaxID=56216 RepID=A0A1A6G382_NEOLE|nr:hypothetical protein A6R68_08632 [Neotoma lepida]
MELTVNLYNPQLAKRKLEATESRSWWQKGLSDSLPASPLSHTLVPTASHHRELLPLPSCPMTECDRPSVPDDEPLVKLVHGYVAEGLRLCQPKAKVQTKAEPATPALAQASPPAVRENEFPKVLFTTRRSFYRVPTNNDPSVWMFVTSTAIRGPTLDLTPAPLPAQAPKGSQAPVKGPASVCQTSTEEEEEEEILNDSRFEGAEVTSYRSGQGNGDKGTLQSPVSTCHCILIILLFLFLLFQIIIEGCGGVEIRLIKGSEVII